MTTRTPRRFLVGSVFAVSLVVCGVPWGANQVASAQDQSLFAAFIDADGASVSDMTPGDVEILWDDVPCEILELEPIHRPVRVTIFIDNATESVGALTDMREGVKLFLAALPADIEVAIGSMAGRPQIRIQSTTERGALADAVGAIAPEGGSAVFFDTLYEEAEKLEKDKERQYSPVIVMVAVGGSEGSTQMRGGALDRMMESLYVNGSTVHTLLFRAPYGPGTQMGRAQSQWGSDIAASTRGKFESLGASHLYRTLLPALAEDLARKNKLVSDQYLVTYKPPKGASDQPRIQMRSLRRGLTVFPSDNGNIQ